MKFQTNECPLCGKVLKLKKTSGVSCYSCPAEANSHYEVEMDNKTIIQHMYAHPYAVDNYENASRSRIHQWKNNRWSFMHEVPRVTPRRSEELLAHLQRIAPIDEVL